MQKYLIKYLIKSLNFMDEIRERTLRALRNSNLTSYKIAKDTAISQPTINNYRENKTKANDTNINILAKYFGITTDDNVSIYANNEKINKLEEEKSEYSASLVRTISSQQRTIEKMADVIARLMNKKTL